MIDSRWFWEGKKVTFMGLGLLGRGVGDVAYIASQGAEEVIVTDMKTKEQLADSLAALQPVVEKYKNIRFVLGGHHEENFVDADMVIQAAGVPKNSLYIDLAKEHGIPVYMSTALAAKWCMEHDVRVVGVTGTRGKSTVTHLIFSVMKMCYGRKSPRADSQSDAVLFEKSGLPGAGDPRTFKRSAAAELASGGSHGSVFLGGNVRGVSTLQLLADISPGDTLVLELDSWQLQGFGTLTISPNVSVFTNLMPDHLNYYTTMDDYFADKAEIFLWQKEGDTLVCGAGIASQIIAYAPPVDPIVPVPTHRTLKLVGEHNQENAALAAEALRACGLSENEIEDGLRKVEPVEGRLQFVKNIAQSDETGTHQKNVAIYNDNNATTPEATVRALESFGDQHITLICGGSDKGIPFTALVEAIRTKNISVILLPGTGSDKLAAELNDAGVIFSQTKTMLEAVAAATAQTSDGVILLSPACASFGLFKNEYDRNDQFLAEINKL